MADFGAITKKLVADAILNRLPGLTGLVDFKLYVSESAYDPETDTASPVYNTIANVKVVEAGITMEDVTAYGVTARHKKLLIPGVSLPQVPRSDVDKVVLGGKEWNVTKVKEVPGGSLLIVFIDET